MRLYFRRPVGPVLRQSQLFKCPLRLPSLARLLNQKSVRHPMIARVSDYVARYGQTHRLRTNLGLHPRGQIVKTSQASATDESDSTDEGLYPGNY